MSDHDTGESSARTGGPGGGRTAGGPARGSPSSKRGPAGRKRGGKRDGTCDETGPHGDRRGGGRRSRDGKGRYTDELSLDAVRAVFDAVQGPVVTSTDVADHLDVSTQSARSKLDALVDRGDCQRRKTGRTIVYWRTDE